MCESDLDKLKNVFGSLAIFPHLPESRKAFFCLQGYPHLLRTDMR